MSCLHWSLFIMFNDESYGDDADPSSILELVWFIWTFGEFDFPQVL